MVVGAQVGNGTDVGVLVLRLVFFFFFFIVGDIVDPGLVPLAIGVNHWGAVTVTGVALVLHVALLFTVVADNVGVTGAAAVDWGGVGGGAWGRALWGRVEISERLLLLMNGSNLVNFFIGELIPEDGLGLAWLHRHFDGSNFL